MRLILDTHVFLWYISADPKLPANFRAAIQEPAVWPADLARPVRRRLRRA